MKVKVLVFPCGSEIALEINRSLRYAKEVDLWGATSCPDHGEMAYEQLTPPLPFYHEPNFLESLAKLLREGGFDYFIPAYDPVLQLVAEHQQDLPCKLLANPPETIKLCASKRATYRLFANLLPVPICYDSLDEVVRYPVFLKPDNGSGSKGTFRANSREEAAFWLKYHSDLVIFDYLPGREYTVDCFTATTGQLLYCGGRTRERIMDGIAVRSTTLDPNQFRHLAEVINRTLSFRGTWFFQLKEDAQGVPHLMEIGPRLAGSMGTHRLQGINFTLAALYQAENHPVRFLPLPCEITYDRALEARAKAPLSYEALYVDLDDCLILRNRLNYPLLRLLYQSFEANKRLILLTRHATDPRTTLAKFRLQNLFDEVIWLTDRNQSKASFITEREALFIDDSFGERQAVHEALGIPVCAPDMVELFLRD